MEQANEGRRIRIPLALRMGGALLLLGLSGCGGASSDPAVTDPGGGLSRAAGAVSAGNAVQGELPGSLPASPAQAGGGFARFAEGKGPPPVAGEASVPFGTATEGDRSGDKPPAPPSPEDQQAQRAAREQWYAAMREAPEAGTRLFALEVWARQPGDGLDPVTYGLVDEDDTVRARAQELYEQYLQREMQQNETR